MPSLKVRIPVSQLAHYGTPLAPAVKAAITRILESPTTARPPRETGDESKRPVVVWVSDEEQAQLESLALSHGYAAAGPVATALLNAAAGAASGASNADEGLKGALPFIDVVNQAAGDATRPDQRLFNARIEAALPNMPPGGVLLAEAATGIGKSRGFLAVALRMLIEDETPHVVVAAPSYNVLLQSVADWKVIEAANVGAPEHRVLLGQQEFVSATALRALLESDEQSDAPPIWREAVRAWLEAGGPCEPGAALETPWLAGALRSAVVEFPYLDAVRLGSDTPDEDPAKQAYAAQFQNHARMIFCTHAMLAVEVRQRRMSAQRTFRATHGTSANRVSWLEKEGEGAERPSLRAWEIQNDLLEAIEAEDDAPAGRLPDVGLLIVDEAHLLEEAFARVFATGTSVWRLHAGAKRILESKGVPKASRARLEAAVSALDSAKRFLRDVGRVNGVDAVVVQPKDGDLKGVLARIRESLQVFTSVRYRALDGEASAALRRIRQMVTALELVARSEGARSGLATRVSWSPTIQWPSIEIGRHDVSSELDYLWANIAGKAVCVSATLLDPGDAVSGETLRRILGIRPKALRLMEPVRPRWVTDPVTLYLPEASRNGNPWLVPPRSKDAEGDPQRRSRWWSDVADYVATLHREERGGILVLMTSHVDRAAVSELLLQAVRPALLLSQEEGRPLDALRREYLTLARRGEHPVMVAVGAAWTGLSLSDEVPREEDRILMDLVLPRLPIGVNRSLTHLFRKQRAGFVAEIHATVMTLRQGIGRLIRRDGLAGRRLHVLDGRVHNPVFAMFATPARRVLQAYTRVVEARAPE